MWALVLGVCAQVSQLVQPLELAETPPDTRSIAVVRFDPGHEAEAASWRDRAVRGRDFESFARQLAMRPVPGARAMFGTVWRGILDDELESIVFDGPVGSVLSPNGSLEAGELIVAQHIERDAACRQIFVSNQAPNARVRADAILRELQAGADFARIARHRSDDKATALRNGELAIFERGPRDALLREAAFDAQLGEIVGPIESPLGYHLLQRIAVDSIDPRLRDDVWARARGLRIAFVGAEGASASVERDAVAAQQLADDLARRIRLGADMAGLAREFDDDRGGRERAGDLGWVRRRTTEMPPFFDKLFVEAPGTLIGPIPTQAGLVLLRREDPGPRTRIALKKNPFLQFLLEMRSLSRDSTPSEDVASSRLFTARAALFDVLDRSEEAQWFDALADRCVNAAEFRECARAFPETWTTRSGKSLGLRALAVEYAAALIDVEARYMADRWPARDREIETKLTSLRERLVPLGESALDVAIADLGLSDPRVTIQLRLLAEAADIGGHYRFARDPSGGLLVLVSAANASEDQVLHLAVHAMVCALSSIAREPKSVPVALARLDMPRSGLVVSNELHGLLCVESAHIARVVFDQPAPPFRFARGSRTSDGARGSGSMIASDDPAERTSVEFAVGDAWNAFLDGTKSRSDALASILIALE